MSRVIEDRMERYFDRLWPINRSITGPGFRESLDILSEIIPTVRLQFKTGDEVFDWVIPKEWKANAAYILDPKGNKFADFHENNLHLVGYSLPISQKMRLEELKPHIHTPPAQPDAIPYVTSYFDESWGFCMKHNDLQKLPKGSYTVLIDTQHYDGHLEIGEAVLPGKSEEEILWSSYLCHPSMANNELSGPLVLAFLYEYIKQSPDRALTHRFVFTAETIGAICYLKERGSHLQNFMKAGYVLTCLGTAAPMTYKCSRMGETFADRVAQIVLRDQGDYSVVPFDPFGSDERQYCSPGFNLPVGSFMRARYGEYPEYHTSLDNKELIGFDSLRESLIVLSKIADAFEENKIWRSTVQSGEPHLSKRNLYPTETMAKTYREGYGQHSELGAIKWLLNLSDGTNDLLHIAERSRISFSDLVIAAQQLYKVGLLEEVD